MPRRHFLPALLMLALALPVASHAAETNAQAIVEKADAIRFPTSAFQIAVKVTSTKSKGAPSLHEYQVLQKGHDNSIVRTMAPATEKGQVMLLKGADLWLFLPSVSQPVRLPLSQRLTGQVANGDLARANFAGDYNAKLLRSENVDGQDCQVLELIAARKGVTYHRVLYWVNAQNFRPYKVEFYTLSGRLMKTGIYSDYKNMGGAMRPAKLVLQDALKKGEESVLEYTSLTLRDIPDKFFAKDFLRKLGG